MASFKNFIARILSHGKINQKNISLLTSSSNLETFLQAFTHKSFSENNYERLELKGDRILNDCVTQYLVERFPQIINIGFLTKLQHRYISKKILSKISYQNNFVPFIRVSQDSIIQALNNNPLEKSISKDILEDVFEALIGAIDTVCSRHFRRGVGYALIYSLLKYYLDKEDIPIRYDLIYDDKSRVKELYDKLPDLWGGFSENIYRYWNRNTGEYGLKLFGYYNRVSDGKYDFEVNPKNKKVIANVEHKNPDQAEKELFKQALIKMTRTLRMEEKNINPYYRKTDEESKIEPFPLSENFKNKVIQILKYANMKEDKIKYFTKESSLVTYRSAFINKSSGNTEFDILEFKGGKILDDCVSQYLLQRFSKIINVGYLTKLTAYLISKKKIYSKMAEMFRLQDFIQYNPEIREKMLSEEDMFEKLNKETIKSFIGATDLVSLRELSRGLGFALCFNIVEKYLDGVDIPLEPKDLTDVKTRIKEIYDFMPKHWNLLKNNISDEMILNDEGELIGWNITLYGYPYGNKMPKEENKEVLAKASGEKKSETLEKLFLIGLSNLKKFGIRERPMNLYKQN